jgi:hypothetical protein
MPHIILYLSILLVSIMTPAKELKVSVDGKEVKLACTVLNHEITEADKGLGNQTAALNASFLFYGTLAKGDIPGAAKLSVDPVKTVAKWTKYKDRAGADIFKQDMLAYFTSKNMVLAELVLGEDIMLVVKTEDYTAGQFYQKKDGKYLMTDTPASAVLGKVLTMIQEGTLTLK